jgi:hypothetical protein
MSWNQHLFVWKLGGRMNESLETLAMLTRMPWVEGYLVLLVVILAAIQIQH